MSTKSSVPLLVCLLGVILPTSARANQDSMMERVTLGGYIGIDLATIAGPGAEDEIIDYSYKPGPVAGVSAAWSMAGFMALRLDVAFVSKGYSSTREGMPSAEVSLRYLEMPILVQFMLPIGRRFNAYAHAGPSLSILLDADFKDLQDGSESEINRLIETVDIGVMLGLGAALKITERSSVFLDARYNYGQRNLLAVAMTEQEEATNRAFYVTVGYQTDLSIFSGGRE